jgi:hypothetical protein
MMVARFWHPITPPTESGTPNASPSTSAVVRLLSRHTPVRVPTIASTPGPTPRRASTGRGAHVRTRQAAPSSA